MKLKTLFVICKYAKSDTTFYEKIVRFEHRITYKKRFNRFVSLAFPDIMCYNIKI